MRYVIEGTPIPLQRVRFVNNHCWDSQKALKHKVSLAIEQQHSELPPLSGPLKLLITFYFKPSQVVTKRHALNKVQTVTERHALTDPVYLSHIARPDLSNLIKFIEDIAIGILYSDDSIIAEI